MIELGMQQAFNFFALGFLLMFVCDFALGWVEWWRRFLGR